MIHQALYLRYRPKTFAEVKGQEHVVKALQSAVKDGKVGHAYMLHGPRGTGKTTTARLLAKALNCTNIGSDGEPCLKCESCLAFQKNKSFDLHELDAASNNKVDDMRALLERVNLATPGRAKVYLLDEAHMLTAGAENALLKTLEEPPPHVTWVLATTEPHKVAQTIRSRCQVFELSLLDDSAMAQHVRYVAADAGLDLSEDELDYVISSGGGSVRDALSALDSVTPGVQVMSPDETTSDVLASIAQGSVSDALAAVGEAVNRGHTPRVIGETVLAGIREGFLTKMGVPPTRLSAKNMRRAQKLASSMSASSMVSAMETLGVALVNMRQAPDPRVDIEVALMKLCQFEARGTDQKAPHQTDQTRLIATLTDRVSELETLVAGLQTHTDVLMRKIKSSINSSPSHVSLPAPSVSPSPVPPPVPPAQPTFSPPQIPSFLSRSTHPAPTKVMPHTRSAYQSLRMEKPPPPQQIPSLVMRDGKMVNITSLSPTTPTEVVEFAGRYLKLDKATVVNKATEMLGPKRQGEPHSQKDLQKLWECLLDTAGKGDAGKGSGNAGKGVTGKGDAGKSNPAGKGNTDKVAAGKGNTDGMGNPGEGAAAVGRGTEAVGNGSGAEAQVGASSQSRAVQAGDVYALEDKIAQDFPGTEFVDQADEV